MSDYELDRHTKLLLAAYFAEYEELKKHCFAPDDPEIDEESLEVALSNGVWRDLEFAKALYEDDQIVEPFSFLDGYTEMNYDPEINYPFNITFSD